MAVRGRALAVLAACACRAADRNILHGLDVSNDSALDVVPAMKANGSDPQATASSPQWVNASDDDLSRLAVPDDAQQGAKLLEAVVQEKGLSISVRSKDVKDGGETSSPETVVASVSADGTISEELAMNDALEQSAEEDDVELVDDYNENKLNGVVNISESVAAQAPVERKRSSMVRSERLSPDFSLGLASSVLAEAAEAINSTMSREVRQNSNGSVWHDFRTLFVLLFILCLPMVAVLVVANLCMDLDIPKPRHLSITKFPHPAGLDAVRRRPLVK